MANALYRRLPGGTWLNQGNPGGPVMFRVNHSNDGNYYPYFTWNGLDWIQFDGSPSGDPATCQTALDTYVGKLNAGTA